MTALLALLALASADPVVDQGANLVELQPSAALGFSSLEGTIYGLGAGLSWERRLGEHTGLLLGGGAGTLQSQLRSTTRFTGSLGFRGYFREGHQGAFLDGESGLVWRSNGGPFLTESLTAAHIGYRWTFASGLSLSAAIGPGVVVPLADGPARLTPDGHLGIGLRF